ncbi:hypothetical protein JL101_035870 (plasmid) [Skermanella rosea]|uniref:hypothetical protein n=1 Tax=Skermanella rosea TaxID=1817965 RepID=UPI001932C281|nr:hypothetical protein [Skermanella rosea]UEM08031.1 hypothetical protein JL101_035870 [Skermanella rosea]
MSYPDDYDYRRNPNEQHLNDEQLRQVEATHDLLDAGEAVKAVLDKLVAKYGLDKGEVYSYFADGFSDLGHLMRGGLDIDEQRYRDERSAIREWDAAVHAHHVAEKARLLTFAGRLDAERTGNGRSK